jgi:ammonium transporter, Amt family
MTTPPMTLDGLATGADVLFLLMGAILVFAMHGGFAFLEVGTVRHKNQVNALVKIIADFAISTVCYFAIGYSIAYGIGFMASAEAINGAGKGYDGQGLSLVKFFFLATFAAAVPAIISGGIAERARFWPQCVATALIVALFYPVFEGIVWNKNFGIQEGFFKASFGEEFHDFAGSVVVHAVGGWAAFAAIRQLGPRIGRYKDGKSLATPPSSIVWLALGSWLLCVGWFGFNVMSAQSVKAATGLVAINSLMAMCGGILAALVAGDNDPGFVHNGALAGLVAVCAGSDVFHPLGALFVGGMAGVIFVYMFQWATNAWQLDDVLGVWPLHGLCGLWGGIACGIFGLKGFGGLGGVSFLSQAIGSLAGAAFGLLAGVIVYGLVDKLMGLRMSADDELMGADLAIHNITATPEADVRTGRM